MTATLTEEQFHNLWPAVRGFHRHQWHERADMASSHRLGFRQKHSIGDFFWTHPMCEGVCFPTRKQARAAGWRRHNEALVVSK